jgi:ABC-type glycerol-3-phosphate transport system substrate-binding protein
VINSMMEESKEKMNEQKDLQPNENAGLNMNGHILIRDKETGEELVNKRNAIHYGNMAFIVANALNGTDDARVYYMAFGNGGTSVDTTGKIIYKSPRVSEAFQSSASLYSRTFKKIVGASGDATNQIEVITGTSYSDIKVTSTLSYSEPADQDLFDSSTNNDGSYVFDELGLFSYPTDPSPSDGSDPIETSRMLTHVVFHPVQKAQNRIIEIIYTVRVQLS